ncbi:hypothetical protein [Amycolatopsis sp. FDAARGOS 1241]|uniref:hypothetical protein n=1 Tax=Amycolatopsis sp. FDAARGOS 1241 TaxID=2778070 RepID=UPI00194F7255|nr:hypothetical protein [Amycolatopsis sp. FDAARGOS 1241]QRP44031.1 hypothetical protein I6J71_32655 [Amycolatopsis sp. FDAARGOS 1241]
MSYQLLDAMSAEVAYRAEQLRKAGRDARMTKQSRPVRWLRTHRLTNIDVPVQEHRTAEPIASRAGHLAR